MYLHELSRSKFHSVTSSNVILYNDAKNSIFIKSGFNTFWKWALQLMRMRMGPAGDGGKVGQFFFVYLVGQTFIYLLVKACSLIDKKLNSLLGTLSLRMTIYFAKRGVNVSWKYRKERVKCCLSYVRVSIYAISVTNVFFFSSLKKNTREHTLEDHCIWFRNGAQSLSLTLRISYNTPRKWCRIGIGWMSLVWETLKSDGIELEKLTEGRVLICCPCPTLKFIVITIQPVHATVFFAMLS